jgi:hypothetical protein
VSDPGFWWEVCGRLGPPILAGTIVAALLNDEFDLPHIALVTFGLILMLAAHWHDQHRAG